MIGSKIKSIKYLGKSKTYSVTMRSDQHNYFISDQTGKYKLVSANSHAVAYGYLSYFSAYLKANYMEEFYCAYLTLESQDGNWEKVDILEKDAKKMGIKISERKINNCKLRYEISGPKTIVPSILCKGLPTAAAADIVGKQPFSGLRDLADRTEGKTVNKKAIEALFDAGYFPGKMKKERVIEEFGTMRDDNKKARSKGVVSMNIFG